MNHLLPRKNWSWILSKLQKKYLKIAPHWPEANVEIQQFMDALIKVMRSEWIEGKG